MIFLDTGYFKALYDEKDPHHNASLKIKDYINEHKETTVINTTVMVETLNRAKGPHDIVEKIYDDLHDKNQVIELTDDDYELSGDITSNESGTHPIEIKGKGNYTGTISSSWLMYDEKQNNQKEEGVDGKGDIEILVNVIGNTEDITIDNFTIDLAKKLLSEEDLERYNNGENVLVYIELKEEEVVDVDTDDKELILAEFDKEEAKDIKWFDITVWKKIGNDEATKVHELSEELDLIINVPDEYKDVPANTTRTFYLARSHDKKASILAKTNDKQVEFSSNKFSIYALGYKDVKNKKKGDGDRRYIPNTSAK